jgi:ribosomal protein L28
MANVQSKKFWLPDENRSVILKVSTKMMRTIDKLGLQGALKKYGLKLNDLS